MFISKYHTKWMFLLICMGTTTYFPTIFTEANNFYDFPFAPVDNEALLKRVYSERKEFAPIGVISFKSSRREAKKKMVELFIIKVYHSLNP